MLAALFGCRVVLSDNKHAAYFMRICVTQNLLGRCPSGYCPVLTSIAIPGPPVAVVDNLALDALLHVSSPRLS